MTRHRENTPARLTGRTDRRTRQRRVKCARLRALVLLALTIVFAGWTADIWLDGLRALGPDFNGEPGFLPGLAAWPGSFLYKAIQQWDMLVRHFLLGLLPLGLFIFTSVHLYRLRSTVFTSRALVNKTSAPEVHALILLLSNSKPRLTPKENAQAEDDQYACAQDAILLARNRAAELGRQDALKQFVKDGWPAKDLSWDKKQKAPQYWNWQQPLRTLSAYAENGREALKEIILIGSAYPEDRDADRKDDSFTQIADCMRLLDCVTPPGCIVRGFPRGVDFEDYDALYDAICEAIDDAVERLQPMFGSTRVQVCVDITGGQAATSIPAAVAAINREALYSYVQTAEPFRVRFYRARIDGMEI
jgi:hypothetical protein